MRTLHQRAVKPGCLIRCEAFLAIAILAFNLNTTHAENRALALDGEGSYVELPPNIFRHLSNATVEAWVKWETTGDSTRFFSSGEQNQDVGFGQFEDRRDFTVLMFFVANQKEGPKEVRTSGVIKANSWYHLAAVSGETGMKLYLNGVLLATNSSTASFSSCKSGQPNFLGKWNGTPDFHGQIDEFRVWNAARTADQIREGMFTKPPAGAPGLVGWWSFDDGQARDGSTNHHDGKLVGKAAAVLAQLPKAEIIERPAVVYGKIRGEDGNPASWCRVSLEQNAASIASMWSDQAGTYSFAAYPTNQSYAVSVVQGKLRAKQTGLLLKPGERLEADLILKPIVSVSGTVSGLDGKSPLTAVVVQAIRSSETNARNANRRTPRETIITTHTDDQGNFRFVGLKPGRYQLRCHGWGEFIYHSNGAVCAVEPDQPTLMVDFRLPPFKKGTWETHVESDGPRTNITFALAAADHGIWLRSTEGMWRFDGERFIPLPGGGRWGGTQINSAFRDGAEVLWIGTQSGAWRYDPRNQRKPWTQFASADGLISSGVNAIGRDAAGAMWFGTDFGLSRYDGKAFREIGLANGAPQKFISTIATSRDGTMWFGTFGDGVFRHDGARWTNFTTTNGLPDNWIYAVLEADGGTVWFGTGKGAVQMTGTNIVTVTRKDGLIDGTVHAIARDNEGVMWFGTPGGLSRYDGRTIVNFTQADGLPQRSVRAITRDAQGVLWIGTAGGMSSFTPGAASARVNQAGQAGRNNPARANAGQTKTAVSSSLLERKRSEQTKAGIELKPRWDIGKRYVYRLDLLVSNSEAYGPSTQVYLDESTVALTYSLSVLKERDRGGRELEFEILALERLRKNGDRVWIDFDSKGDKPPKDQEWPVLKMFPRMIGQRIKLLLDATNKVEKIEGYAEFVDKATANLPPWPKYQLKELCGEEFLGQIADFSNLLPKTVRPDQSSAARSELNFARVEPKTLFDLNFAFKGSEVKESRRCLRLDFSGPISTENSRVGSAGGWLVKAARTGGTLWFDPRLGAVVELQMEQRGVSEPASPTELGSSTTSRRTTLKLVALEDLSKPM